MSADRGNVGVVGGGTMGVGIAYVFAAAGRGVTVVEPDAGRADAVVATIAGRTDKLVAAGRMESVEASAVVERVAVAEKAADLAPGLDVVIEAVPEIPDLKATVLRDIETREPRVIGTNTSSIAIGRLARALSTPELLIGMHFFNPVWSMPLLELIRSESTSPQTVDTALRIGAEIGKETILVNDVPGFATSRLGVAIGLEAIRMLEDGVASAADIDRAMELGYRHPMGPLRLSDLVGLDVRLGIAEYLSRELGPRFEPPQLLRDMVARGDLGKKTGRGFFDWSDA
ncbi:3-hydroxyacyl-CoA dehydrogenase family protein [Gordonia sp. NPDC003429]